MVVISSPLSHSKGAFLFSQAVLPHLLKTAEAKTAEHPPTLIFTGATASVKANAQVAAFAAGKFGLRALAFSIAKEFAPQGVHVAHAIIDGPIDVPGRDYLKSLPTEAKISAEGVCESLSEYEYG
jgi:NAD(P)-dependent dehydrogenase (short-subunit alcohol dehydrogenase family)